MGHILATGVGVNNLVASGNVCCVKSEEEAFEKFSDGDILVIESTSNNILPLLKKAKGIIVEEEGSNTHAAIVGMALEIPVVLGAVSATDILKSGTVVTIDASRGIIQSGVIVN